jgi:hypothetical protein
MKRNLLAALATAGVLFVSAVAQAHERYFVYTYDWFTPFKFEKEVELHYTHLRNGDAVGQIEFEYGITDRWVVAPYLIFEKEDGKTKFVGGKLEQRYRFGEFTTGRIMPAVYLEVKKENEEPYEVEGKLIGTYMPNRNWIASANLIAEKEIESGSETEFGYSMGVARIFAKHQIGFEAFGDFSENRHFVGPTVGFRFDKGVKFLVTGALNYTGGGQSQIRLLLEKEF